jgi:RimJ/RimL family protein N-acetyltransferase
MEPMPVLETPRLWVRPFVIEDLEDAYQLFDVDLRAAELHSEKFEDIGERARWLQWSVLNYEQLAYLNQPPYGDRAIVLKSTGQLIGACGYVPCLNAYEQLPGFHSHQGSPAGHLYSPEFGLFYAIASAYRRQGFAAEAAQALVDYAFDRLSLRRIIAETDYDNDASTGVMRKLGMRILRNPLADPPWLQVVGVLERAPRGNLG